MIHKFKVVFNVIVLASAFLIVQSCSDFEKYELPDAGSIPDETPPSANFTASQGEGVDFLTYSFSNLSSSATMYFWDFGNGNTSTAVEPQYTFPGLGTYTVSLTASDNLGVENTFFDDIEVEEPVIPDVPDPTLINSDFNLLPKSSGSDCTCSGWINKDLGDQGESSSGNGGDDNVLKFDNNEPDLVYQEFEVMPNENYKVIIVTSFKEIADPPGTYAGSMLELRVLAGSGYVSGYTPTYYTNTVDFPQSNFGYTTVSQMEDPTNNLLVEIQDNPDDDNYFTYLYTFNSGANDSLALAIRGLGGADSGEFGYNSGDEEIRADSVTIIADN